MLSNELTLYEVDDSYCTNFMFNFISHKKFYCLPYLRYFISNEILISSLPIVYQFLRKNDI